MLGRIIAFCILPVGVLAATVEVNQEVAVSLNKPSEQVMHHVHVGSQSALTFNPNRLNANIGDQIIFEFHERNHTLTESTLEEPCTPKNGFDTGFNQFNPDDRAGLSLILTVNSLEPRWFFCKQDTPSSHCHEGMVFGLNPGDDMQPFLLNAINEALTESMTSQIRSLNTLSNTSPIAVPRGASSRPTDPSSVYPSPSSGPPSPSSVYLSPSTGPPSPSSGPSSPSSGPSSPSTGPSSPSINIEPIEVSTVTRTVGCSASSNINSVRRSVSLPDSTSSGNVSLIFPFVALSVTIIAAVIIL